MEKKNKRGSEKDGQVFVWQGYTGKVELISFKTFLTRPVRRIALGADHSLFLTHDGSLFSCGSNEHGQLGLPNLSRDYSFDPCLVESLSGKGISNIACGTSHSAAVTGDGSLYCWGCNQIGQCGIDPSQHSSLHSPTLIELFTPEESCAHGVISLEIQDSASQVSCGASHTIVLSEDGRIWVWGKGPQLGLGEQQEYWKPTVMKCFLDRKVLRISAGDFHNLLIVEENKCVLSKSKDDTKSSKSGGKAKDKSNIEKNNAKQLVGCPKCKDELISSTTKLKALDISEAHFDKDQVQPTIKVENVASESETESRDISQNAAKLDIENTVTADKGKPADTVTKSRDAIESNCDTETKTIEDSEGSVLSLMTEKQDENAVEISEETNDKLNEGEQMTKEAKSSLELDEPVEIRKKSTERSLSVRSETSCNSTASAKLRSKSFLDDTGAREFLARQFQDDDIEPMPSPAKLSRSKEAVNTSETQKDVPSSPGAYMMQTVTNLTSQVTSMTSHVTSMTSKAISSMVPGKLKSTTINTEEEIKSSNETLTVSEFSDLESGSTENINFENSTLDISNLTVGDISPNASLLSIPESDVSIDQDSSTSPGSAKRTGKPESPKSVSKDPQSIRTIEAKQENLKRRSLSLNTPEEAVKPVMKTRYSVDTEIWAWGRNNKGQLGLGDMLDRSEPYCIQILTGKRVCKIVCGSQHTLALTSTGEVYSWGLNTSGQLGHNEISSSPAKIELTYDCCVWDLDAGSNHSIFLMDNAGTAGSKPEVFYAGKHPSKDLYVPIYKTPRLTPLKFVRKAGWICCVRTGGDNCACLAKEGSEVTEMVYELSRFLRQLSLRLHRVIQVYIKRLQISGFFTSLEVLPYKPMMGKIMAGFIQLTKKLGAGYEEMTDTLREGDSILTASLLTSYEEYVTEFKSYSRAYEDMVAVGGFEYCTKSGSSTFENLQEFYLDLLPTKAEEKPNHATKFRQIMSIPLTALQELSQILNKFSKLFEKSTVENNLLSSVHLNLEHLIRTSGLAISDAENTRAFWENSSSKISDNLKMPSRRMVKDSKTTALTLAAGGRFSSHNFYLFNDLFIHSQYSTFQSYPLELVWIDVPTSESPSQQGYINVVTPEDILNLSTPSSQLKVEWLVAFNSAINKVLSSQKSYNRQNSGERMTMPVIRYATHVFTKHAQYKEATYKGYWLNGKVHGSGLLRWSDGRRYRGKFKHGAQTGYGKMIVAKEGGEEETQEGVWKDGKLHGHGKIKYSSGDMYEGFFKDGLRHGHGVYRKGRYLNSASFVYVGEWLFDKKHGYGVMDDIIKGEKYMGMWQEDNRHGDGIVVTLDGMYFEGNFQYNKLVGYGLMLTDDNSCYEGEFSGITLLAGKGTLTFPNGDKIEGTFNGTWNQGLKISGTFRKMSMTASMEKKTARRMLPETNSSLYGKLCVKPERKWEEIFYQCYESLHYSGDGEPNTSKAWDQVVSHIVAGKQGLKDKDKSILTSKQKMELSNLEQLEKIPTHRVKTLTIEQYNYIVQYLSKSHAHPLGKLVEQLVDVFRAAYIGIGAHPRLLHHAIQEIESFSLRIFKVIRILFPELPTTGSPVHAYPEASGRACGPMHEVMGVIQRQVSEVEDDVTVETVSSKGILQPILLPKIYPALFDLYALHSDREDEKYWERMQKLNKQGDMSLMAYLGVEQTFWCIDESVFKTQHKRISSVKDQCYSKAVEVLQQISTAFCPIDKLEVIEKTFEAISQTVQNFLGDEHMWCMDDLFPIFQFVVIRAQIHHLGAEISFIEDLMESHLEFGEFGIMFTTLKACYYQIQNERMPIH